MFLRLNGMRLRNAWCDSGLLGSRELGLELQKEEKGILWDLEVRFEVRSLRETSRFPALK